MEELILMYGTSMLGAIFGESKHEENIREGVELMKRGLEFNDEECYRSAISEFLKVNDDDFLYAHVYANLFMAICYAKLNKYPQSYRCLDYVKAVDYDFFTRKKDTIEELRKAGDELRVEVKEAERQYLEELNRKNNVVQPEKDNFWKIIAIVSLVVVGLLIVGVIAYLVAR